MTGLLRFAVAARLHITIRTERDHVARILAGVGAHSDLGPWCWPCANGVVE
ncbi:MAG: hypothetical protein QOI86_2375, partial [Actinomycetota bacterium]|nr:hypothetical protein [Actinomycetota bacterium]